MRIFILVQNKNNLVNLKSFFIKSVCASLDQVFSLKNIYKNIYTVLFVLYF